MTNDEHNIDKWGGDENGMLGCSYCPAAFTNGTRRQAHIEVMHRGKYSGPSEGMLQMARIRPELAPSLGIDPEILHTPHNLGEMRDYWHAGDTLEEQQKPKYQEALNTHPVHSAVINAVSDIRMMEANALSNASSSGLQDEIRNHRQLAEQHLNQYAHGIVNGVSIASPATHLDNALHSMDRIAQFTDNYDHWNDVIGHHEAAISRAGYLDY
jgi:hypothetical protein